MAVWAKTKGVLRTIWPVVRSPEWLDVTGFCIRAYRSNESCAADLAAGKIVQMLHPFAYLGVANDPRDC